MMHTRQNDPYQPSLLRRRQGGFTLVELMVGMVVATIVAVGVFSTYQTTTKTVMTQRQVADMQQQMRGSQFVMEREIRAAGYDPTGIGTPAAPLGVQDIRRYDIEVEPNLVGPTELNPNGSPTLTINFDLNADGVAEQSTYLLYDIDNNLIVDLARVSGGNYELLAESVEAIGFAYAFDADFDDAVDLYPPTSAANNGNIIWAVDSDNDNDLDRALDTNWDGNIDDLDTPGGVPLAAGPFLMADVPVDRIRMVRVWLLCRSTRTAKKTIIDTDTYLVGDRVVGPFNDTTRRRMLEMSIRIRNL